MDKKLEIREFGVGIGAERGVVGSIWIDIRSLFYVIFLCIILI